MRFSRRSRGRRRGSRGFKRRSFKGRRRRRTGVSKPRIGWRM